MLGKYPIKLKVNRWFSSNRPISVFQNSHGMDEETPDLGSSTMALLLVFQNSDGMDEETPDLVITMAHRHIETYDNLVQELKAFL